MKIIELKNLVATATKDLNETKIEKIKRLTENEVLLDTEKYSKINVIINEENYLVLAEAFITSEVQDENDNVLLARGIYTEDLLDGIEKSFLLKCYDWSTGGVIGTIDEDLENISEWFHQVSDLHLEKNDIVSRFEFEAFSNSFYSIDMLLDNGIIVKL